MYLLQGFGLVFGLNGPDVHTLYSTVWGKGSLVFNVTSFTGLNYTLVESSKTFSYLLGS